MTAHDAMTWLERLQIDPSLRTFVEAEVARGNVELASLRAEHERQASTIRAQAQAIAELQAALKAESQPQPKKARLRENAR